MASISVKATGHSESNTGSSVGCTRPSAETPDYRVIAAQQSRQIFSVGLPVRMMLSACGASETTIGLLCVAFPSLLLFFA